MCFCYSNPRRRSENPIIKSMKALLGLYRANIVETIIPMKKNIAKKLCSMNNFAATIIFCKVSGDIIKIQNKPT